MIRLNVRYPLSDASDIALEYIHSGIDALIGRLDRLEIRKRIRFADPWETGRCLYALFILPFPLSCPFP